jgi:alpha-beta hydrolase superfamily lysophospholipase
MTRFARALCALVCWAMAAGAFDARAAGMNGAVILHGNGETPESVAALAGSLRNENALVATPELPWSARRYYDRAVSDVDAVIDAAVSALRDQGARRVYLIGQSLGATYALRYASRPGVTGVVLIAPNQGPESPLYVRTFADDLRRARELVAHGRAQQIFDFLDLQWGSRRTRARATANAFLSYFDPAGPMNFMRNVQAVGSTVLMLWIVPVDDPVSYRYAVDAFQRARPNPGSRLIEVTGGYQQAVGGTAQTIVQWMQDTVPYIHND